MPLPTLAAPLLLAPSIVFAALALLGAAPGEWGRAALIAWTAVAAALLAGAGLQAGAGIAGWLVPALGLAAIMTGGPPGLVVAALAGAALAIAGDAAPFPRWIAAGLAAPPLVAAARGWFG